MADTLSMLGSGVLTLVVLIFCELTPKIIASTHAERLSTKLLWPVRFSIWMLSPFARLAAWCSNRLARIAGFSAGSSPFAHALGEEEIRAIIAGTGVAAMAVEKREMLQNVFQIGDTQVQGIMIPRVEVTAIEIDDPIAEILSVVGKTRYSRIPVYRKNFDNLVGILYVKDLLQYLEKPSEINLQVLLRPVHFVPDTARIETVLRQFQSMHIHMAAVVDEFGGVEGIVTLEDLLEEIVGEIRDEHDTEVDQVRELGPNLYSVAGSLPVKDFNRLLGAKVPESRDYTTVVGFLQARTGRLLQPGDIVRYQDLSFSIEKTDGLRIVSVRVRVPAARSDEKAGAAAVGSN
jgi:putative hemolysin